MEKREQIKQYLLENRSTAVEVARDLDSWDGSFPQFSTWDLSELIACYCGDYKSTMKFVNEILLNSLDTLSKSTDTVRFSEYGEYIEEVTEEQLEEEVEDYIDEIVDGLLENYPHNVNIYNSELEELLDEDDEEDDEN